MCIQFDCVSFVGYTTVYFALTQCKFRLLSLALFLACAIHFSNPNEPIHLEHVVKLFCRWWWWWWWATRWNYVYMCMCGCAFLKRTFDSWFNKCANRISSVVSPSSSTLCIWKCTTNFIAIILFLLVRSFASTIPNVIAFHLSCDDVDSWHEHRLHGSFFIIIIIIFGQCVSFVVYMLILLGMFARVLRCGLFRPNPICIHSGMPSSCQMNGCKLQTNNRI